MSKFTEKWAFVREGYIVPISHINRPIGYSMDHDKNINYYANVIVSVKEDHKEYGILISKAPEMLELLDRYVRGGPNKDDFLSTEDFEKQTMAIIKEIEGE